jgi:hypothetical protein
LDQSGLLPAAEKIAAGVMLDVEDAERLFQARLPLLGKLVELVCRPRDMAQGVGADFVVLCPLASLLEEYAVGAAIVRAKDSLQETIAGLPRPLPLWLALDRWSGAFRRVELLEALQAILAEIHAPAGLALLGPTAGDVETWLGGQSAASPNAPVLKQLLTEIRAAGVSRIESHGHLGVCRLAAECGLRVVFGQPLNCGSGFPRELVAVREGLAGTGRWSAWYPQPSEPLDRSALEGDEVSGWEVLRAIAMARLVLPGTVEIRAPLATLGEKVAQVALDFGATHLGPVAADPSTAAELGLPGLEAVEELIGGCAPTAVGDVKGADDPRTPLAPREGKRHAERDEYEKERR